VSLPNPWCDERAHGWASDGYRLVASEVYSGHILASNTSGGTVVLVNPCTYRGLMASSGFCRRHGGSCACLEVASRGSFYQGPPGHRPYTHRGCAHARSRAL
jgi:hypothetical protein